MKAQLVSVSIAIACAACGQPSKEATEFGRVSLNLTLNDESADAAETPVVMADGGVAVEGMGPALNVKSALAFVRHVEFYKLNPECDGAVEADAGNDCEEKIRIDGPWVVNLMTGEATPSVAMEVPAGAYSRVDVRFEDADKNADNALDVPEALVHWTLVASGDYAGGTASKFDMRLKFNEDARFRSDSGIEVTPNGTREMLMALPVQRWFNAVELDDCSAKDRLDVIDGVLVIEDAGRRCNAIENAIKEAMKHPHRITD